MKAKKWVSCIVLCLLTPAVVVGGTLLFAEKQYAWISLCIALLACVPFFLHFERKSGSTQTLILIAALLSWLFFGNIVGVGVGTLLSAVSVGQFVNLINRHVPLLQHIRALAEE